MNCHQCKNMFDEFTFVPRLLIVCGHSFCDNCLGKIHSHGKIVCPECRTVNSVECIASLPRNLALLNSNPRESSLQCLKHGKKYQAFCDKEKMLLCVNCILEDEHRNHHQMIESIASAYEKQKDKMGRQSNLTEKIYSKIQGQLNKLEESYRMALRCYEESHFTIEKHFGEVKRIVQTEEDNFKQKSRDLFTNFERKNKDRQSLFVNSLQVLDQYVDEASRSNLLSMQEFLQRSKVRENLSLKLDGDIDTVGSFSGLTLNRNSILDSLNKAFDKVRTKELKEANSKEVNKMDYNKPKVFTDKLKKPCIVKDNAGRFAPKKYSKKQGKQVARQAIRQPVLSKRPVSTMQKPIPTQISGFQQSHTLFKSFLSSNASFFIQRRFIYVFGGFCEESNSVLRFNLDTLKWDQITSMMNRSKFGVAEINKQIVILGGKRDKLRISSGQSFRDSKMNSSWGLDNVRSGFGMTVFNQELHVVGGNDGEEILTVFEKYSQSGMAWKKLEPLIEGRDQLAVAVGRDNKMYAIGGFGGTESICLRSVQRYDPVSQKWEFTKPMLVPRRALSAVTLADGIYAVGGFDGQNYLSSVEKFDQYSNTWVMVADMKEARCTHSAVAIFQTQEILVFGGFDFSPLASVQKYSVVTDRWQSMSEMPAPRFMHGCLYSKE